MVAPVMFLRPPFEIRRFPDPMLRLWAREVTEFDQPGVEGRLTRFVKMLGLGLTEHGGVGLAATQVGVSSRVIVVADNEKVKPGNIAVFAIVNPEIVWRSAWTWRAVEGCLSLPDVRVMVDRPYAVKLTGQDVYGEPLPEIEAEHWEARVFQHEIDHLDGVLTIDHLDRAERRRAVMEYMQPVIQQGWAEKQQAAAAG